LTDNTLISFPHPTDNLLQVKCLFYLPIPKSTTPLSTSLSLLNRRFFPRPPTFHPPPSSSTSPSLIHSSTGPAIVTIGYLLSSSFPSRPLHRVQVPLSICTGGYSYSGPPPNAISTNASPIPTPLLNHPSFPDHPRRPRSKTAEEDGGADRWPLVEQLVP
ncbi:hypothetical protein LINPERHAP1_LOCUS8899, partial [Linum perenne]